MSELAVRVGIAAAQGKRWATVWDKAGAPAKVVSYKWQAAFSAAARRKIAAAQRA